MLAYTHLSVWRRPRLYIPVFQICSSLQKRQYLWAMLYMLFAWVRFAKWPCYRGHRVLAETAVALQTETMNGQGNRSKPTRARGEFLSPDYNITWRLQVLEKGLGRFPWTIRWVTYAPLFGGLHQSNVETVWRMVRLTFRMWTLSAPCPVHEGRAIRHLPRFYRQTKPWSEAGCEFVFRSTRYTTCHTALHNV